ncbi:MAG: hypothetical protein ACHQII_00485 [Bacteroidia bacterium]
MTTDINITGQWTFVIVYGPEYGEQENQELYFDAEFIQDKDLFTGTGRDTGGSGASPDIATIKGFLEDDEISFIKQYTTNHYIDEEGKITIDKNVPGPEINYYGSFNKLNGMFEGHWEMLMGSQKYGEGWFDDMATGTWAMKRK